VTRENRRGLPPRVAAWAVVLAAVSLSLAVLLAVFGQDLAGRPDPGPHTFSRSALGHRALAELLRGAGVGVVSRRSPVEGAPGPRHPLVLAEPFTAGASAGARLRALRLEAAARGAPLVLVLPKWIGAPDRRHPGWIAAAALRPLGEVRRVPAALGVAGLATVPVVREQGGAVSECFARFGGRLEAFDLDLRPAQLLEAVPGMDPIVVCGDGVLVARVPAAPMIFLVSDPDLLNNQGLGRAGHAALVHGLLARGLRAHGVIFDETVHGLHRRGGLLAEAFRFPLVFAVLQSFVLAVVVVWSGAGRFGKPLPPPAGTAAGTEVLIDNTAQLLSQGRHAGASLARYYRQTLRAVAAAYFLPPDLPERETVERLQRIAEARGLRMQLRGFARRVEQVAAAGPAAGDRAVRLAHILYHWRLDMTEENGHRRHP
jgi:hypothetical protein